MSRVRILAAQGRFVFGCYRRHMETIRYLNRLDDLCAARGTVRNWNTITAIARTLRQPMEQPGCGD